MVNRPDPSLNQMVLTNDVEWNPLNEPGIEGIYVKSLRYDKGSKRSPTILLKFEPGSRYPAHMHPAGEEIFVLEGGVRVGGSHLKRGDYLYTAPGNIHAVYSEEGCVLFLIAPEEVVIIGIEP